MEHHTHIYIYIYVRVCMYVCTCICVYMEERGGWGIGKIEWQGKSEGRGVTIYERVDETIRLFN